MKFLFLAFLLSPAAFADEVGVADCLSADGPLTVSIYKLDRSTSARVNEKEDQDGIEFEKVKRDKTTKRPAVFMAPNFHLQVNTQEKPNHSSNENIAGMYPSQLSATSEGRKIEADLFCTVY